MISQCAISFGAQAQPSQEARLLRFPALYNDQVVFVYAGDLYAVSRSGGVARQLTSHAGYESFPRFSPDGKQIAFTAQYEGSSEVYAMPAMGGAPTRLTYSAALSRDDVADRMGPNNIVMAWTPDGKGVVHRTRGLSFNDWKGHLMVVPASGGLSAQLPFSVGSWLCYSPDGSQMAMNRTFREFRTWKYYKGGMADDIWIFTPRDSSWRNITENPAQDIFPMWHKDRIYFCSDRERTMNIYVYETTSRSVRRVTSFTDYDVKFPSLGPDGIVFENGGHIHILNLQTEQVKKIEIQIADDAARTQSSWVDAGQFISTVAFSPDGMRVLMGARGEVWSLPAESGITRNLTNSPGAHDRNPAWSPDGRLVAYVSDRTGEDEIWIQGPGAEAEASQATRNADTYKFSLRWSPDSKRIMWADKKLRLQFVDVASGRVTQIDNSVANEFAHYEWSPDGKWVVYARPERLTGAKLCLFNVAEAKVYEVTDGFYGVANPAFSPDGKYVVFVSARDFDASYSNIEWNYAYFDMQRVYLLPLEKATRSPFQPRNNEVMVPPDTSAIRSAPRPGELPDTPIDVAGLAERAIQLPHDPANYSHVAMADNRVYYLRQKHGEEKATLLCYDLAKREEKNLGQVDWYALSDDRKRMLLMRAGEYHVIDRPTETLSLKAKVEKSGMKLWVDRAMEWKQIYNECWRQMRDFFYAPNMHGVDWPAIRRKYEVLLPYVSHRNDLSYIIGEMIGELNVSHAYAGGGDRPQPELVRVGLLGADISRHNSGYYRIDRILRGANWSQPRRSPLTEPGVVASEGAYITAINGLSTREMPNLYAALVGKAGLPIELSIAAKPDGRDAATSIVTPLADESDLRYHAWVQANIDWVNKASNGQVGYIHIPDMVERGLNEFVRQFYPQLYKRALIIDVRGNGGGNVSPMIIERLQRQLAMISMLRNASPYPNPFQTHVGPKVALCDRYTASDGDLFTYRFKKHRLGKVIGERTWGGVVGIRATLPLADGGYLNRPEFAPYDVEGRNWIIEGYGVDPDINLTNDPYREFRGTDQQLMRALEEVLAQLRNQPEGLPEIPPYPRR